MMNIHIDTSYKSLNKAGEELCGDKVEIIRTDDSIIMVLADGLGSGVKANILATLTSKIIATMLKEGARIDEAVETIASTLPICSVRKIAYSTFSILQVFHNGEAYLAEFDNPSCVFIRNGQLMSLPSESREIAGKMITESRFSIAIDDVFTFMSDGVTHAGIGAILNLGWQWENVAEHLLKAVKTEHTAARIAASLSQVCDHLYMGSPGDDTTVAVAKITRSKVVNLLTGPPINKEDDERFVRDFMREQGKRIVCGGTSANIVSRVLNRQIQTTLDYPDDVSIPPIAKIDGIDLVTEGVLTLSKAVEILRGYTSNNVDEDYFKKLDSDNGAAMLAKMLLEECTCLNLFIGRSINPAHQNPNLPMDLSIKLRIIGELSELISNLGKKVECTYY